MLQKSFFDILKKKYSESRKLIHTTITSHITIENVDILGKFQFLNLFKNLPTHFFVGVVHFVHRLFLGGGRNERQNWAGCSISSCFLFFRGQVGKK